ncbi:hypothetical protein ACFXDH_38170 [Streptomyces sp. NPDC059467]|uniref:hypothetical protein n=1 Tax=Streptomyces sp. NPDC059467 TaxID=3346844 RepID=UPI0036B3926B
MRLFRTIALTIAVVVLLSLAALPRPVFAASRPVTATTIAGSPISVAVDTGDLTVTLDDFVKPYGSGVIDLGAAAAAGFFPRHQTNY